MLVTNLTQSMQGKELYQEICALEQQLRGLLRSQRSESPDVSSLREQIRDKCQALLLTDPELSEHKEIEQMLWKICFYKRIEDFRKRIRKYAAAAVSDEAARSYLYHVFAAFRTFLTEASEFYLSLLNHFSAQLSEFTGGTMNDPAASQKFRDLAAVIRLQHSSHRCLIFLGDLARYRELHSESSKKDWSEAESFYHRALSIVPESGNPHNQLAVLATYVDSECVAVYRYVRSIMVTSPFTTANENLVLLFEKNRQRVQLFVEETSRTPTKTLRGKEKAALLKSVLARFVRLHGTIHRKAVDEKDANSASVAEGMEGFGRDLERLMQAHAIGDNMVLKLLIICVWSVTHSRDSATAQEPSVNSYASAFLFLIMSVSLACAEPYSRSKDAHSKFAQPGSGYQGYLLGPISIFCEILKSMPELLEKDKSTGIENVDKQFNALWEALTGFLRRCTQRSTFRRVKDQSWRVRNGSPTREELELRGFIPLTSLHPVSLTLGTTKPLREDQAGVVRTRKILYFVQWLLQRNEGSRFLSYDPISKSFYLENDRSLSAAGKNPQAKIWKPLAKPEGIGAVTPVQSPIDGVSSGDPMDLSQADSKSNVASEDFSDDRFTDDTDGGVEEEVIVFRPNFSLKRTSETSDITAIGSGLYSGDLREDVGEEAFGSTFSLSHMVSGNQFLSHLSLNLSSQVDTENDPPQPTFTSRTPFSTGYGLFDLQPSVPPRSQSLNSLRATWGEDSSTMQGSKFESRRSFNSQASPLTKPSLPSFHSTPRPTHFDELSAIEQEAERYGKQTSGLSMLAQPFRGVGGPVAASVGTSQTAPPGFSSTLPGLDAMSTAFRPFSGARPS